MTGAQPAGKPLQKCIVRMLWMPSPLCYCYAVSVSFGRQRTSLSPNENRHSRGDILSSIAAQKRRLQMLADRTPGGPVGIHSRRCHLCFATRKLIARHDAQPMSSNVPGGKSGFDVDQVV